MKKIAVCSRRYFSFRFGEKLTWLNIKAWFFWSEGDLIWWFIKLDRILSGSDYAKNLKDLFDLFINLFQKLILSENFVLIQKKFKKIFPKFILDPKSISESDKMAMISFKDFRHLKRISKHFCPRSKDPKNFHRHLKKIFLLFSLKASLFSTSS